MHDVERWRVRDMWREEDYSLSSPLVGVSLPIWRLGCSICCTISINITGREECCTQLLLKLYISWKINLFLPRHTKSETPGRRKKETHLRLQKEAYSLWRRKISTTNVSFVNAGKSHQGKERDEEASFTHSPFYRVETGKASLAVSCESGILRKSLRHESPLSQRYWQPRQPSSSGETYSQMCIHSTCRRVASSFSLLVILSSPCLSDCLTGTDTHSTYIHVQIE